MRLIFTPLSCEKSSTPMITARIKSFYQRKKWFSLRLISLSLRLIRPLADSAETGADLQSDTDRLKTGARQSVITKSARVEKREYEKILTGTSVPLDTCLLMGDTCLLMGDPGYCLTPRSKDRRVS
jgi:hypothetical protein